MRDIYLDEKRLWVKNYIDSGVLNVVISPACIYYVRINIAEFIELYTVSYSHPKNTLLWVKKLFVQELTAAKSLVLNVSNVKSIISNLHYSTIQGCVIVKIDSIIKQ